MMPRAFGTVALLTVFTESGFSIGSLILRKIPKILGILFINETRMEKIDEKIEKTFLKTLKYDRNAKIRSFFVHFIRISL